MERDTFHDPAWYAGGVEVAEDLDEVLQQPGDGDSTSGVSTPSPRVRSRQDRGPSSRYLPGSPGTPDCLRQRMARPAHPKNLPRLIATNARNR